MALMAILVIGSMRQDFDLVSKDYYAQELAYQNTIDASKNQAALSAPVMVKAGAVDVVVRFPAEFKDKIVKADLHFYSPVKADLDKKFTLTTENGFLNIPRTTLHNTNYKLRISWESDGNKYFQETGLNLTAK